MSYVWITNKERLFHCTSVFTVRYDLIIQINFRLIFPLITVGIEICYPTHSVHSPRLYNPFSKTADLIL
jgi:hypothetical protein